MKKPIALILTLALALSLCACGSKDTAPDPVPDDKNPAVTTPTPTPDVETTPEVSPETSPEATPEATPAPTPSTTPAPTPDASVSAAKTPEELTAMIETIIEGADPVNSGAIMELPKDSDSYLYNLYIDYVEGYECVTYAPMMSSTAYFVALVSVPSDVDAEALAQTMKDNANPRKWICVEADQVDSVVNGNTILFYMVDSGSYPTTAEILTKNFSAL